MTVISFILASAVFGLQEDVEDARLGALDPLRSPGAETFVHGSPDSRRAISSYFNEGRESFRLENGGIEKDVVKWVGWKMPEAKSIILAKSPGGLERVRMLIGGIEDKEHKDVRDAALLDEGQHLAVVTNTPSGMMLVAGDLKVGPCESIQGLGLLAGKLRYVTVEGGRRKLHCLEKDYDLEGTPFLFATAGSPLRVAWVERRADGKQRGVLEGAPGPWCDGIGGIYFSPQGKHVAWVTREERKYRAWIDGTELARPHSVVAARVRDDGSVIHAELVKEHEPRVASTPTAPVLGKAPTPAPSRSPEETEVQLVIGGKVQDRVFKYPVADFEFVGADLFGTGRSKEQSLLVRISASGEVSYEEVEGRVGRVFRTPDGRRRAFTVTTDEGQFVQIDGKRSGPFTKIELFYLDFTKKIGFVAVKDAKVQVVVEGKAIPVALSDFFPPLRITKSQLTLALVGLQPVRSTTEIWVRAVPLE
jgi:hypothetical protein